jgi:mRNA-degrading endonuclease toxin of MazEF toxin-antitoxin module
MMSRFGQDRLVIIVGHDALTAQRGRVLVVPLSDIRDPSLVEPLVTDSAGQVSGVAMVPGVGEVPKDGLKSRVGSLAPAGVESLNIALRAALDLYN